jgi:hypothetical protein
MKAARYNTKYHSNSASCLFECNLLLFGADMDLTACILDCKHVGQGKLSRKTVVQKINWRK